MTRALRRLVVDALTVQVVELFGPTVVGEQEMEESVAACAPVAVARTRRSRAPMLEMVVMRFLGRRLKQRK